MQKSSEAGYMVRVSFQKLHLCAILADWVSGPQYEKSKGIGQTKPLIHNSLTLFHFKGMSIFIERKSCSCTKKFML